MGLWSRLKRDAQPAAPSADARVLIAADKLTGFHDLVRDCLERALHSDTLGSPDAVRYYKQGVAIATEALQMPVPQPSPQTEQQVRELRSWQQRAGERLRVLEASSAAPRVPSGPPAAHRRDTPDARPAGDSEEGKLRALVEAEVVDRAPGVLWADIAGLEDAKGALQEAVVLPSLRPDLFTGLRSPAKGLLLFGPPGTGKTMLAKACATEAKCTFFSISASSLTSKWVGESEKLVRALFTIARERAPSIIFIDEVDSILSARSATDNEASKRLKTELLVQMDGVTSGGGDGPRVVVLAATNRPGDLDEAVRRRLSRRIYVPLPDSTARRAQLARLLGSSASFALAERDREEVVRLTDGYSGSDLAAMCREAALGPLRELGDSLATVPASRVRRLKLSDFTAALKVIRPSVAPDQLTELVAWDKQFGSGGG